MKILLTLPALFALAVPLSAQNIDSDSLLKVQSPDAGPDHAEITIDNNGSRATRVLPAGDGRATLVLDHDAAEDATPKTWLGVVLDEISDAVASQLPLDPGTGLIVEYVSPDSPAAKAGLQKHDVLVRLDDQVLIAPVQLQTLIANRKDGDTVEVHFLRKGQPQMVTATLATQQPNEGPGDRQATINLYGVKMDLDKLINDARDTVGSVIVNKKTVFVGPDGKPVTIDSDEIKQKTLEMLQKSGLNDEILQQVKKALAEAQDQVRRAEDQARGAADQARRSAEEAERAAHRSVEELQKHLQKK